MKIGLFKFGMATSLGEGKLNSNLLNSAERIDLVSHPAHVEGLVKAYMFTTTTTTTTTNISPVGLGCRIHRLHFCKGVRPPTNECFGYDTKQSDGEAPVPEL